MQVERACLPRIAAAPGGRALAQASAPQESRKRAERRPAPPVARPDHTEVRRRRSIRRILWMCVICLICWAALMIAANAMS